MRKRVGVAVGFAGALALVGAAGLLGFSRSDWGASSPVLAQEGAAALPYAERFHKADVGRKALGARSSCARCHTSGKRETDGSVMNEFTLWAAEEDRAGSHAGSLATLQSEQSRLMAQILHATDGSGAAPMERKDCLACHAFGSETLNDGRLGGEPLKVVEAVGCEACHGRGRDYLADHQFEEWPSAPGTEWLDKGMWDYRRLSQWPSRCLQCHQGTGDKMVTHRLLAAGHPELTFELANDSFHIPRHWRESKIAQDVYLEGHEAAEARWFYARVWAVGQAASLQESAARLLHVADGRAEGTGGIDYALFDCYACHHDLVRPADRFAAHPRQKIKAKRQALGILGGPDEPGWNGASWAGTRSLVRVLAPERLAAFDEAVGVLLRTLSLRKPIAADTRAAAQTVHGLAGALVLKAESTLFDERRTLTLLHAITEDAERASLLGFRAAEQSFRGVYGLHHLAYGRVKPQPEGFARTSEAIGSVLDVLKRGPAYDPEAFVAAMATVRASLPELPEE